MKRIKRLRPLLISAAVLLLLGLAAFIAYASGAVQLNKPDAAYPRGVDVSSYQGNIDWQRLESQDIDFAFIKATEGAIYFDDKFAANVQNVSQTGILYSPYHFFSFESEGIQQAVNYISVVGDNCGSLPPVVDVELYGDFKSSPKSADEVVPQLRTMLEQLEGYYGVKPIIYTTSKAYELYIGDNFSEYMLWYRSVFTEPKLSCAFWQYSDKGKLDGYKGSERFIDLNVFIGSREELEKLGAGK